MNTKDKGLIAETMILAALVKEGWAVLIPLGENSRYDLVIEKNGYFERVQCKMGRFLNGAIVAPVKSVYRGSKGTVVQNYKGQIECLGIYCPDTGGVYLVPESEIGTSTITLRVEQPRMSSPFIKWAKDYQIG